MSGIFQGDIIIKTALELGFQDMRDNPWLVDHMLEDLKTIAYLTDKYGQKQIDACKEWLANNQVDVYMRGRNDQDRLPCITIEVGASAEKEEMKSMADQSTETVMLLPNQINKPISYVVKPFVPVSYDSGSGIVDVGSTDISSVAAGMILVDPSTGQSFVIEDITPDGIVIESGLTFTAAKVGVVPKNQFYVARVEHSFFQETYNIGCHSHGDPQVLLWLWSIVKYSLLRYKESLLEANGFAQAAITSSSPDLNAQFTTAGGEVGWSRYVSLTGQVENSWIKSPRRIIEKVSLKEKTSGGYRGGIKILSNLDSPPFINKDEENWYTIEENSDEE